MIVERTLITLEDEVAGLLPEVRWQGPPPPGYLVARDRWTDAVWRAAKEAGPAQITAEERECGVALRTRVVFLCGVHRSGTTLLRDLLDGHPRLAVLPSEGSYFTGLSGQMASKTSSEAKRFLCREWAGRLANPINQAPFWLLGRSGENRSPYREFARRMCAWWSVLNDASEVSRDASPHTSVMLAYAASACGGSLSERLAWLAEKTPTNEFHVDRLRQAFPLARFVHVVRHPYSILVSRKKAEERALGTFQGEKRAADEIKRSFAIAAREALRPDYLVVRYEDLITLPWEEMARIARFLDVELAEEMLTPTLAGRPTSANSSFIDRARAGTILGARADHSAVLTSRERSRLATGMTELAARFGYSLT